MAPALKAFGPGTAFFAAAGAERRLGNLTPGCATRVVFRGPEDGEQG